MLAAGVALARSSPGFAQGAPGCPSLATIETASAMLLAQLPEAAVAAGLASASAGGPAARRCTDWSPDGRATLGRAMTGLRALLPEEGCDTDEQVLRAQLDRATSTADVRYGRNGPFGGTHRPYLVTAFAGPHLSTPTSLRLIQDVATPAAVEAWQLRLEAYAPALLGVAQSLRTDAAMGCVPPAVTSRAALPQMDAFVTTPAARHPLVLALDARLAALATDPIVRAQATKRAADTLGRHVQPAMALLRDTVATLTRQGRPEIGLWAQPGGEALHAANVARAGDTAMNSSTRRRWAAPRSRGSRRCSTSGWRCAVCARGRSPSGSARPLRRTPNSSRATTRAAAPPCYNWRRRGSRRHAPPSCISCPTPRAPPR